MVSLTFHNFCSVRKSIDTLFKEEPGEISKRSMLLMVEQEQEMVMVPCKKSRNVLYHFSLYFFRGKESGIEKNVGLVFVSF